MFTTRHGNGHLHARPMTTQNKALEADDSLWFFMSKKGDPVDDLKADPVVNLVYADPSSDTYVSVSGTAAMLEDAAKKQQLWNKAGRGLVPGRPDRPRPRAGAGADHPRQLLGREGKQAGPAVRDGQGGRHRQAAASSASTAKCACAERGKGHGAAAPAAIWRGERRRCSALRARSRRRYRLARPLPGDRHAPRSLHASLLARLPLAAARPARSNGKSCRRWPSASAKRAAPAAPASPWDATRPAELESAPAVAAVSRAARASRSARSNEPDVFRHFFGR